MSPTNNILAAALAEHDKSASVKSTAESPHVLVIGSTGTGKSTSIKNLPKDRTFVLNLENKILPFPDGKTFRQAKGLDNVASVSKILKAAAQDTGVHYIVIDSFTKWTEMLMLQARATNKNYEIFNFYNAVVYDFLETLKKITNKIVIVLAIDELVKVEMPSGATVSKKFCSVEGKVHSTKIEKEFAVVLYTETKIVPATQPPKAEYKFATNTDGVTSAKSPEGMFEFYIPNDLNIVVNKLEKYFDLKF